MDSNIEQKLETLKTILSDMNCAIVAFSGGVDSTVLTKVANDVLGDRAIAVTVNSPTLSKTELDEACNLAVQIGVHHKVVYVNELDDENFCSNPPERCYYCKKLCFGFLRGMFEEQEGTFILDGTNADDKGDWRPGTKAARELGVRSPLLEVGLTKQDIRSMARDLCLPNWDKPSGACLASRIPYGEAITEEKLQQIEESERYLKSLGFKQVRVRHHGSLARIEVPSSNIEAAAAQAGSIATELKRFGFYFVALDLSGFTSGSMNASLDRK